MPHANISRQARALFAMVLWVVAFWVTPPAEAQQPDETAPTLVSISSSPETVDVAAGPAPITVTAQLADDIAGVAQWLTQFSSPSGAQFLQVFGTPGLITGTNLNGTFQGTSMLPQFSESGVWQATRLSMSDSSSNNTSVDLLSAGFPLSFTVTSQQDVTAPTLVSISSSPETIDVAAGPAPITVTAQLADDIAGVAQWLTQFSSPSGAQFLQVFGTPGLITGTNLNGTFQGTSMLPQFSESGVWQATSLSMTDNAGNNTSVDLLSAGLSFSFTVAPTSNATTVVFDNQELEASLDSTIPVTLQSSAPIVSIDFDITVEYTDFGGGDGAFGSQFLLEVFRQDGIFEVIDIGIIGPAGNATCPAIVECDFDLMFGNAPGTYTASGTITSFADGRPLSDVIINGPEQWNVGLGTFSDDFNPTGPEGVINGSVTINQQTPAQLVLIDFENFQIGDGIAEVNSVTSALGATFDVGPLSQQGLQFEVITDPNDTNSPPVLLSATAVDSTTVSTVFSEALNPLNATLVDNYSIDQGIVVASAALSANGQTVILTTSVLQDGVNYTLTVNDVEDVGGAPVAPNSQTVFSLLQNQDPPAENVANQVIRSSTHPSETDILINFDFAVELVRVTFPDNSEGNIGVNLCASNITGTAESLVCTDNNNIVDFADGTEPIVLEVSAPNIRSVSLESSSGDIFIDNVEFRPAPVTDSDQDGIPDDQDACPLDPDNDADGDGVCGDIDVCPGGDDLVDLDNDGLPDDCDICPFDADNDADGDGVCGNDDDDDDGDGIPDSVEGSADSDGDGTIDSLAGC